MNQFELNKKLWKQSSNKYADLSEIKTLLESGANPNYKNFDFGGAAPLYWAIENENFPLVTLLISYGATIDITAEKQEEFIDGVLSYSDPLDPPPPPLIYIARKKALNSSNDDAKDIYEFLMLGPLGFAKHKTMPIRKAVKAKAPNLSSIFSKVKDRIKSDDETVLYYDLYKRPTYNSEKAFYDEKGNMLNAPWYKNIFTEKNKMAAINKSHLDRFNQRFK
mgnify:CR=1 FL=1